MHPAARLSRFLALAALPLAADDMTLIRGSLATLAKGGPAAQTEAARGGTVDTLIMRLPAAGTPWRAKYLAAEWLLRAHLLRLQADPGLGREALEKAWDLGWSARLESKDLETAPTGDLYRGPSGAARVRAATVLSNSIQAPLRGAEQVAALDAVVLETAVRLDDPARMGLAAEAVAARKDLGDRDRTFAFLAAAHAGRWPDLLRWGGELEAGGKVLGSFHAAALARADAFDYAALLAWARLAAPAPPKVLPPPAVLAVARFRIRLKEASGPGAEEVRKATPEGWQESPAGAHTLARSGAVARWLRPAARPMPLCGGATETTLDLHGFQEAPGGARRTERLTAVADPARAGWWTGTWTMESRAGGGVLKAVFDLEMELATPP